MIDHPQSDIYERVLAECFNSTQIHANYFFPDIFTSPFNSLHDQMTELVDSGERKIVIAAPRGIGKTSMMLFGVASRHILFQNKKFVVYLSNSATSAELQSENLKRELLSNQLIKDVFGSVKTKRLEGVDYDEGFSKLAWVTSGGTLVFPRGAGQQIRGVLHNSNRPDLIIIDDLEDKQNIMSEEQRAKLKEWFHSDVMKCISRYEKNYQFIYIDTLKHEDSLLQELIDSSDWASIRLDVCDDDYKSNAPDFMTDEEIAIEVQEHREHGTLDVFYREMRNIPISTEDAVFKPEYFRHFEDWKETLKLLPQQGEGPAPEQKLEKIECRNLTSVVIVDPAKTVKLQSADSAIVGISVDRESQKIFCREVVSGKFYPDRIYREAFDMVRRLNAMVLGVEVTSLHQFISQPLENQMRIEGIHCHYEELKAVGKKEERIANLAPYYRQGFIYHNRANCNKLESQLLSFPRSKLWDVMDAFAYVIKLMDNLSIYFDPPNFDDMEDEYDELENDKMMEYSSFV